MTSLCQLAGDWTGQLPPYGSMVEPKQDGWRCLWFEGADGVRRLWSRNGRPLEGADHIAYRLRLIERAAGKKLFLDGEIVVGDSLAETKAWFERGWKTGGNAGRLHLFDGMPLAEWRAGGTERPLHERKAWLKDLVAGVGDPWEWRPGSHGGDDPAAVRVMPDSWLFDPADVVSEARRIWSAGGEGLMLKDAESPYRRNRNSAWLKVKQENMHKWKKAA